MGRSVSYPSGALVAYARTPYDEDWCANCSCPASDCDCDEDDKSLVQGEADWDWIAEDAARTISEMFPSFRPDDDWRGREDRVVARNSLVDFGFSEYCGLMAYWMVPREGLDGNLEAFAERWIAAVSRRFCARFGEYVRIGGMSDGTSVYQRVGAA